MAERPDPVVHEPTPAEEPAAPASAVTPEVPVVAPATQEAPTDPRASLGVTGSNKPPDSAFGPTPL